MTARTLRLATGVCVHLEDSDPEEVMRHARREYYQIQPADDVEVETLIHSNYLRRTPNTDCEYHELHFE